MTNSRDDKYPSERFEETRRQIREQGERIEQEAAAIEARFHETKQAVDTKSREVEAEIEAFDREWEADEAAWQEMDEAMEGIARDFFRAITTGSDADLENVTIRTAAQFERFLDWHEESSKLWRNGYIGDELQAQISSQFSAEAMASWRLNLMEDSATPEQVEALQERMLEVSEHATFLASHIQNKAPDATPKPGAMSPVVA